MATGLPFEGFLPFSWKDIGAPLESISTILRHDLAQHRVWKRDGANVESTGRAPLQISAKIPFLQTIAKARNENWSNLYPNTYRKFLSVSAEGTTGVLSHPALGNINCKLESFTSNLVRGGMECDVSWIETLTDDDVATELSFSSPISSAITYSLELSGQVANIELPDYPKETRSLTDDLRDISGAINSIGLTGARIFGKIDAVIYRVNNIERALKYSTNVFHVGARQNVQRIKDAMRALKLDVMSKRKKTVLYFVRTPMTLAHVAHDTGDSIQDIVSLNPGILSSPIVPANTVVRYYAEP